MRSTDLAAEEARRVPNLASSPCGAFSPFRAKRLEMGIAGASDRLAQSLDVRHHPVHRDLRPPRFNRRCQALSIPEWNYFTKATKFSSSDVRYLLGSAIGYG